MAALLGGRLDYIRGIGGQVLRAGPPRGELILHVFYEDAPIRLQRFVALWFYANPCILRAKETDNKLISCVFLERSVSFLVAFSGRF